MFFNVLGALFRMLSQKDVKPFWFYKVFGVAFRTSQKVDFQLFQAAGGNVCLTIGTAKLYGYTVRALIFEDFYAEFGVYAFCGPRREFGIHRNSKRISVYADLFAGATKCVYTKFRVEILGN